MMGTLQKWLMATVGLGAAYLVLTNPNGFYSFAKGTEKIVGGTTTQIITGGKRGG